MAQKKDSHPLLTQAGLIGERGLVVFDDVRSMPVYHEAYTSPYMVVGLNLQGWMRGECDARPVEFRQHDVAVLAPRHVMFTHATSDDYRAMLIVMSVAFQQEMKRCYPAVYHDNHHYLYRQDVPLDATQFAAVHRLFKVLRDVSRMEHPKRWEMLGNLLNVLFLSLQDYRRQNGIASHIPSRREELFMRFHQDIIEHSCESREVRFYADLQHLSPKHFATTIKEQTGINALDWINGYVTIQAKLLLNNNSGMTVQEIATELGFPDASAFSRFFKQNTGVSPTDYRLST